MATFSSKKLSEVYESLIHGDNGSGTAIPLGGTGTNVQLRTGDNDATTINITSNRVSLGQSATEATTWKANSGMPLDVRQSSGNGGGIIAGHLTLWQSGSSVTHGNFASGGAEGGQLNLKDGGSNPASGGADDSIYLDNYMDASGQHQLRFIRVESGGDGASDNVITKLATMMEKNQQGCLAVGNTAIREQLSVQGNISVANGSARLGARTQKLYVNSATGGGVVNPGSDDNIGSSTQPFKTLSKALAHCSPYSINTIYLYAGSTAIGAKSYNICLLTLSGLNINIRLCSSETGAEGTPLANNLAGATLLDHRDNTTLVQSTTNELNASASATTTARWDLWSGTHLSLSGMWIKCSYPGTSGAPQHKVPFRCVYGGSLSLGSWNSTGTHATKVSFENPNTNSDTSANYTSTVVLCAESGLASFQGKLVEWTNDSSVTSAHGIVKQNGQGSCAISQIDGKIPGTNFNDQYNEMSIVGYASTVA